MIGAEAQRAGQLGLPLGGGLARAGIDQIEGDAGEMTPRQIERRHRLGMIVAAAEEFQRGIVERLDAERQPIDARGAEAGEALGIHRAGIGLQRDLGGIGQGEDGGDAVEQGCDGGRLHQRGRAAAEEHRGYRAAFDAGGEMVEFGQQRRPPSVMVDRGGDVAVEVAIRAFRQAERPMDIDAEAGRGLVT